MVEMLWASPDHACLSCVPSGMAGPGSGHLMEQGLWGSHSEGINLAPCQAHSRSSMNSSLDLSTSIFSLFPIHHFQQDFVSRFSAPLSTPCLGPMPQLLLEPFSRYTPSGPPHPAHPIGFTPSTPPHQVHSIRSIPSSPP